MPNNRKPTALKVLHGDRKDRINTAEPKPALVEVSPPDWLSPAALSVWERLGPDLAAKKVLTFWDVDLFARYCWLEEQTRHLMATISADGPTVDSERGVVKHPAAQVLRDMTQQMLALAARFGLSPADRSRITVGGGADAEKGAARLLG